MSLSAAALVAAACGAACLLYSLIAQRRREERQAWEILREALASPENAVKLQGQIIGLIAKRKLAEAHLAYRDLKAMRAGHMSKEWCRWPQTAVDLLEASLAANEIDRAEVILGDIEDLSRRVKIDAVDYDYCQRGLERMRDHYLEHNNKPRAADLTELLERLPRKLRDRDV